MRAFLSIELSEQDKEKIEEIQISLKGRLFRVKWMDKEKLHLTLVFFDDIRKSEVEYLKEIVNEEIMRRGKIKLEVKSLTGFPKEEKAYTLVLKVGGEEKKLKKFVKSIERGLSRKKIDFDKKNFVPHITIGRTRNGFYLPKTVIKEFDREFEFEVDKISFIKSDLNSHGVKYIKLTEWKLL